MKKIFNTLSGDVSSSLVVFLVALPLCLGIALGSQAPLFAGIIAGVVGGIVIGGLSGSALSVSGPANAQMAIVAAALTTLPSFESFLLAVVIAGLLQLLFGFLKFGILGEFIPNTVIKGMLAAIGIILILKQIPHIVGYDKDFEGDESFSQIDHNNTFSALITAFNYLSSSAILIGLISITILILWDNQYLKNKKWLKFIPAPLVVVVVGGLLNEWFVSIGSSWALKKDFLVSLPSLQSISDFNQVLSYPNWQEILNKDVWIVALTIALVASLETLLSIEAADKIDPLKRYTPANRELKAQGIGNLISGLVGGLPITSVIVRSSANVNAGAKSKYSAIMHGVWLLLSVIFIPHLLNKIPYSALAAILIMTGYKLAKPSIFKELYQRGWDQLIPFTVTITAILFTDLLMGIFIGIAVSFIFILRSNFKSSVMIVHDNNHYLVRLRKDVSFLNKATLKNTLENIPAHAHILIDVTRSDFIDKDVIDVINDFLQHAHLKHIHTEVKKSQFKTLHQLIG